MKKILALILSAVVMLGCSATAFAATPATPATETESPFTVTAPTFPDAYIITEIIPGMTTYTSESEVVNLGLVSATVFVEESYDMVDGELIVTDSRLLSKEEVDEIGIENFENLNEITPRAATNTKGKLTITFSGSYTTSGNSVSCNLTGNASWGLDTFGSPENNPAAGKDYMGITWAGGFSGSNGKCTATDRVGNSVTTTMVDSIANGGRVWEFEESLYEDHFANYTQNIDISETISKKTMTGNGNTAEAVLKYIHTYQAASGSISISAGSDSVSASYTLQNVDKQWPLVCTVSGIPY